MRLDEAARHFLRVRFLHQGRNPVIGIDCIGLLVCASQRAGTGHAAFDSTDYGRDPHHGLLERHLVAACGPAIKAEPQPGDVVTIDYQGATRHVGIVGEHPQGGLTIIHTSHSVKAVTEQRLDAKWRKRVRDVYRSGVAA